MGIRIDWFDADKTILLYDFEGRWAWSDLHDAIKQVNVLLESVSHPVYVIVDFTKSSVVPSGALSQMRTGSMNTAPNWAGGVFVGVNTFIKTLIATFIKVYPGLGQRYMLADTIDQALNIINEKRGSGQIL